jgi:hypothetical protein
MYPTWSADIFCFMHDVCVCTIGFIDLSVSLTSTYSAQRFSSCETSTPTMTVYIFFAMLLIPKSILSSAYATVALKNRFPGNKSSMNDALTSRCTWRSPPACLPHQGDLAARGISEACVRGSHACADRMRARIASMQRMFAAVHSIASGVEKASCVCVRACMHALLEARLREAFVIFYSEDWGCSSLL